MKHGKAKFGDQPDFSYLYQEEILSEEPIHQLEVPAKPVNKITTSKSGTSLGYGWFQGFSLFVTGLLLLGVGVIVFLLVNDESLHQGPVKYVLQEDGTLITGGVKLNPLLVTEQKTSQLLVQPDESTKNAVDSSKEEKILQVPPIDLLAVSEGGYSDESVIETYMQQAKEALKQQKLVTPMDQSALYFYQQVLQLDANHEGALLGIRQLADQYYQYAEKRLQSNDFQKAWEYVMTGLKIVPDHQDLLFLKADIEYWLQQSHQENDTN